MQRSNRGNRSLRLAAGVVGVSLTLAAGAALANPWDKVVLESVEISDFYKFNTTEKVAGATILTRDYNNNVVDVDLSINTLEPGQAYSIWIAVFNNPWYCSNDECGLDDIPGVNPSADPRVHPSVFYGGGFLADNSGSGRAAVKIVPGRTKRELFGATKNYGLERLWGTEIHVVLRSHGPALVGSVAEQIGTASGACNTPNGMCANVFSSFHPPLE